MLNLNIGIFILTICIYCNAALANDNAPNQTKQLSHQEILTYLLQADMAVQRNMFDVALENYLIVAKSTSDPKVAQLATELAIQIQSPEKALSAAEIWANAQPEDLQAQLIAATLFSNSTQDKASVFLNRAFAIQNSDIDQHLLIIINQLSPEGQQKFIDLVYKIAEQRSSDPYAQLAAAQFAAVTMDINKANKKVALALKLKPDLTSAIELNAKIIRYKTDADKPALQYLEQQVKKFPKNSELRLFYITALLDNDQIKQALPHLNILVKDKTYGGEAYLYLGEIYINDNKLPQAEKSINKALTFTNSADKAKFYLAQIAEHKKDNVQAIRWYEDVSENSEFHTQSFLRAAYLYAMVGNYDDAIDLLQNASPNSFDDQKQILLTEIDILVESKNVDKALDSTNKVLAILPDDIDFLYARSVIYSLQDKPSDAEHDLRAILAIDPNNSNALNALGFTLANQPHRVNEALPLLQKALTLNPGNPAYMDSLGWLLFKLGRNQEAISMLDKAYSLSGDNEIAAHLGEVLWSSGKQDAAKAIWAKALLSAEDPGVIHDTMGRLNIPASTLQSNNKNKAKAAP